MHTKIAQLLQVPNPNSILKSSESGHLQSTTRIFTQKARAVYVVFVFGEHKLDLLSGLHLETPSRNLVGGVPVLGALDSFERE
jgi:hypothetical protein